MSAHFTDADVRAATLAHLFSSADPEGAMRRALEAVAPTIAARALREVAESANTAFGGVSVDTIRRIADEIGGSA